MGGIGDCVGAVGFQCFEGGEPSGIAGFFSIASWGVEEACALAGHGVFIAAGEVECAAFYGGKVGGDAHKAVITIDDEPGVRVLV